MAKITDELKRVALFSDLNQRQLGQLGRLFRERRFAPGMSVVREGKMSGIGFFLISEGEATVTVGGEKIATLGPGDHFGELAMITERERTATVTAETQVDCLEIPFWDFKTSRSRTRTSRGSCSSTWSACCRPSPPDPVAGPDLR
jgi:CRP-like cAMP-binding protein